MSDVSGYIKNPKDPGGSKWICKQDEEDFEQEKLIKEWANSEGVAREFEFQHINRKGTARNTRDSRCKSLQEKIRDDSDRTLADVVAGCDGRDSLFGLIAPELERTAGEEIQRYLFIIGFNEGEIKCLKNQLVEVKKLPRVPKLKTHYKPNPNYTLKKQLRLERYLIDSESLILLELYKE